MHTHKHVHTNAPLLFLEAPALLEQAWMLKWLIHVITQCHLTQEIQYTCIETPALLEQARILSSFYPCQWFSECKIFLSLNHTKKQMTWKISIIDVSFNLRLYAYGVNQNLAYLSRILEERASDIYIAGDW